MKTTGRVGQDIFAEEAVYDDPRHPEEIDLHNVRVIHRGRWDKDPRWIKVALAARGRRILLSHTTPTE